MAVCVYNMQSYIFFLHHTTCRASFCEKTVLFNVRYVNFAPQRSRLIGPQPAPQNVMLVVIIADEQVAAGR